jgi:WD40 repeat protein
MASAGAEEAWAALVASLPLGPPALASNPSSVPTLGVSLPGLGPRSSDAVARTAVSLAFLKAFRQQLVAPLLGTEQRVTSKEVVERLIKPLSTGQLCLASRLPSAAVGVPTAFISHAWGTCHSIAKPSCSCAKDAGSFHLLVDSVTDFFAGAVDTEVFVWLDVFAVNQHDASGSELDGGLTLRKTVDLAAHTLVVLERSRSALALSRLWCLYEIGSTPPEKLQLLTRGFAAAELRAQFQSVDVGAASCWDRPDGYFDAFIRGQIQQDHGSQELFQQKLKLRLLLRPTSYEADLKALLKNSTDAWSFDQLRVFVQGNDGVACIAGGPGEGKSTIAAALCRADNLVHACHFCKASDATRQDVGEVIRSLAYQLATARIDETTLRFPEFTEAVLALDDSALEQLGDHSEAFEVLLKKPLRALPQGTRVVLLFDALDEAETRERPVSTVLSLLLDLGRLGVPLSVIVTTRPEPIIIDALEARWKDGFREFEPDNLRVGGGGKGSTVLLRLLQRESAAAGKSVDDMYTRIFAASPVYDRQLVGILLAAREPPSLMLLEELGVRGQLEYLPGWGTLFYVRDYCVHMLHRSLAEWLLDPNRSGEHAADVANSHAAWADLLSAQLNAWLDAGGRAPVSGHYIYRNVLAHLDVAGRSEQSRKLLMRLPWLQAMLRERGIWVLIREISERAQAQGPLAMLLRTLRLSAPGLTGADADVQLLTQLVGRLGWVDGLAADLMELISDARAWRGEPWLCPVSPTLREPVGPLEAMLKGHTSTVSSLAIAADGRILSGSCDNTVRIWNAATGECERVLEGHTSDVTSLAIGADGRIVSGSCDKTLRIWHATTGECERVLEGHTDWVSSVAIGADGCIVSSSVDNTLRIWHATTGECECVLEGHTSLVSSLAIASDGRIVSGSRDKTVRIWHAITGECERVLEGHTDTVTSLAIGADGRIVSGSWDKTVRIWNTITGESERVLNVHTDSVSSLAIAADGCIVSGSWDNTLRIWNAATGECERVLEGHTSFVSSLAIAADGRIISGSRDNNVRIWNATTGDCERVLEGHSDRVSSVVIAADGRIVSCSRDNTVRIWSATTGDCERVHKGHTDTVTSLAIGADGRIVSGSHDNTVRIWNTSTGECERVHEGHTSLVSSLAIAADGLIVSGSRDETVRIWHATTGECERVLEGHTSDVTSLAIGADGRIVSGSCDKTVRIWHATTGECERVLEGHTSVLTSLAIAANGRIVSGSRDKTVRIWNATTGECERVLEGHTSCVSFVAILADGRILFRTDDNIVRIWNATTGRCRRVFKGHSLGVNSVATAIDGRIVSGSCDNTLRIWNAATGECERVLEGHTSDVTSLAIGADGLIVSGAGDNTVRIWNAATGECERVFKGHTDRVSSVAIGADGRILSGSRDKTVRIWNATTGECERVLEGHTSMLTSLAIAANGRIVSGSRDMTVRIWNATTGECEREILRRTGGVLALAIAADGRIISGSRDNNVRIWNATTGECERVLEGHSETVTSVAIAADGRIISGSVDKTVRIWNATTGECERVLEEHSDTVTSLAIAADGRIVSGSNDRTVRIWNATTDECELVLDTYSAEASKLSGSSSYRVQNSQRQLQTPQKKSVVAASGRHLPFTDHVACSFYTVGDTMTGQVHVIEDGNHLHIFKECNVPRKATIEDDERGLGRICMTESRRACGHFIACSSCNDRILAKSAKCPVCNTLILPLTGLRMVDDNADAALGGAQSFMPDAVDALTASHAHGWPGCWRWRGASSACI